MRYWVWVFGEIDGLRWVLKHKRMAFAAQAGPKVGRMSKGDRAVLYVTRGAFHNPTRDEARLGGLVTVIGNPRRETSPLKIAGREFTWSVRIRCDVVLPERTGPPVRPLALKLSLVRKPDHWGNYFRPSPIELLEDDFVVFRDAVQSFTTEGVDRA